MAKKAVRVPKTSTGSLRKPRRERFSVPIPGGKIQIVVIIDANGTIRVEAVKPSRRAVPAKRPNLLAYTLSGIRSDDADDARQRWRRFLKEKANAGS